MSFESRLEKAKQIPNKYWMIVYGFVHEMEDTLHSINESAYYNIPDLVTLAILCFYYDMVGFVKYGKSMTISGENKRIATKTEGEYNFNLAYIGYWINSMTDKIVTCKIRLNMAVNTAWNLIKR